MTGSNFPRPLFLVLTFILALPPLLAIPALARSTPQAPSTDISVNTTTDELNADGDCSLREAIQAANTDTAVDACPAGSGDDTILVPPGVYSFTLPSTHEDANQDGDLDISQNLTMYGSGAAVTIINGNQLDRVFHIPTSGISVVIGYLTITEGYLAPGTGNGGGVFNSGDLFLGWVNLADNSASRGGGIATDATGTLYIQNSALHHNIAPYTGSGTGVAGAVEHFGPSMTVVNSTVSDNVSGYFNPTGNLRDSNPAGNTFVIYSTISDNDQGGLFTSGGSYTVASSIISNLGQNCNAGTFTSGDYNLISNAECGLTGANDLTNTDPLLEMLQDAGGETLSRPLQPDSPALDRIPSGVNGCGTTYETDQRDIARPLNGLCDVGAVEGMLGAVNAPPVALANSYVITEDWSISVGAPGLLVGDYDPDGDPISVTEIISPSNGTIFFANPDGAFGYLPNSNFNGADIFVYTISDGVLTDTAIVTMTVLPVEDAPWLVNDIFTTTQNSPLTVDTPGVLFNDYDPEGQPLTAQLAILPAFGDATLAPNGALIYTPTLNFTGLDTFTYLASDGNLTSTATVTLTVLSGVSGPDLTVPMFSAVPDEVCKGEYFSLAFALSNQGDQDAGGHQVFFYNDAAPSGFTNQTFTANIAPLLAGQTRYFSLSASSALTGTRYLKALVDGGEVISETDETNNSAVIPITVQPDPAPGGSLLINGGTPFTIFPNLTLTLNATDTGNCATSVAEMRFTYEGLTTPWEPYATTKEIIVLSTGEVQIAVQFRDEHRNTSPWIEATILIGEGVRIYLPLIGR